MTLMPTTYGAGASTQGGGIFGMSTPPVMTPFGNMAQWGSDVGPVLGDLATVKPFSVTTPSIPGSLGVGGVGGAGAGFGKIGLNMPTAQLALSGIGTIGNLWAAFQAQKLAKQQFAYTKNVTDTNLANQIKTYNTGLTDRANNRAIVEGRTPDQTKSYIDANSLKRFGT